MKLALKILMWFVIAVLGTMLILFVIYLVGPRPRMESIDNNPLVLEELSLEALAASIEARETAVGDIKEDNQAQIIWNDSTPKKTTYSLVYMHGFSASQGEGWPLHLELAKRYGMNLYLPRLAKHGLKSPDALGEMTPKNIIESAKHAVAVGKQLGDKVILLSCSTGSTVSLYLAANDPAIAAVIALSPNIQLADPNAKLLVGPWAKKIVRTVYGGAYTPDKCEIQEGRQYWSCSYHVDALINLQLLLQSTMHESIFKQVTQPFFMGYYYKNDKEQDSVVSVAAMLKMYNQLGTPNHLKQKKAFPEAQNHIIGSPWYSKSSEKVKKAVFKFMEEVLKFR